MLDFSIFNNINFPWLENINFVNTDNLFFLGICLFIAIIILVVCIIILVKTIKITKKATSKFFNIDFNKFKINKNENIDQSSKTENDVEVKDIDTSPRQKPTGGNFISNFSVNKKQSDGKQKDAAKAYKDKEAKSISEHLNKLKVDEDENNKDTLASKMPSREVKTEEDARHEKIKIAVPKHFTPSGMASADEVISLNKDDVVTNDKNPRSLIPKKVQSNVPKDSSSVFKDEAGVSRMKLEHELKTNPKIWQAGKSAGLNLSPLERAKLMKEVFSPTLGTNISKTDLKWSIKKLNQKMLSTKDPQEHAKIRKEIAFFKNIGDIK